jgi:transcriptional regulator with XRE-family HTH domain
MKNMKERIKKIMEDHGLSASKFADKIGVPRSGLSHILSGRNKPSLDYVLKILNAFPDIDPYWLIKGKKSNASLRVMAESSNDVSEGNIPEVPAGNLNRSLASVNKKMEVQADKLAAKMAPEDLREEDKPLYGHAQKVTGKQLERIVYFFTDGTFKEYRPL